MSQDSPGLSQNQDKKGRVKGPQDSDTEFLSQSEQAVLRLLTAVSNDSSSGRTSWIFFLAVMAYFFVAIAGVTHKNLLLNSPVELPFLGIGIELTSFFTFAPLIFVLFHFGLLIQHVLLAQKVHRLNAIFGEKGNKSDDLETHVQHEIHSYFFTQLIANHLRAGFLKFLLRSMFLLSFFVMPVVVLLYFQIAFLPFHDNWITAYHRAYITLDLFIVLVLLGYIYSPIGGRRKFTIGAIGGWFLKFTSRIIFVVLILFFSYGIATVPDGFLDRQMTKLAPVTLPVQYPQSKICNYIFKPENCSRLFGKLPAEFKQHDRERTGFILTAYLFEGSVDLANGASESLFNRNLVVADENLVAYVNSKHDVQDVSDQIRLSLRGRNLRYATLDRTNLRFVDFTDTDLVGASLRGTDLTNARISCAQAPRSEARILGGLFEQCADLRQARLEGALLINANLIGADFDEADFTDAQMNNSDMTRASAKAADFSFANLSNTKFIEANLEGAKFLEANLQGAQFRFANLQFANFLKSNLQGTNLSLAKAEAASFRLANLNGSQLRLTWLQGSDFQGAQMQAAVFKNAILHAADLRYARLEGADLSFARLQHADFSSAEIQGADFRLAMMWRTQPPQPLAHPKMLIDLRGIRVSRPNRQDHAAIAAIIDADRRLASNGLDASTRSRLKAFLSKSTDKWTFSPDLWKFPENARSGEAGLRKNESQDIKDSIDPQGKSRGEFLAYLACGDRNSKGYLAQSVVRRVLRAKTQIDVGQFCKTLKSIPLAQCSVRADLQKNLPPQIQKILEQNPDCSF